MVQLQGCTITIGFANRGTRRRNDRLITMQYSAIISRRLLWGLLLLTAITINNAMADSDISEKIILGWIENIYVLPDGLKAKAKLDTGAKTSSIHARDIEHFERDGESWVRFHFSSETRLKDEEYQSAKRKDVITLEAPLTRSVLIKRHKRPSMERPVVMLPIELAGKQYEVEFTLADRRKFLYPVLLGRRFLKDVAIVDPGNTFLRTRTVPRREDEDNAQAEAADEPAEEHENNTDDDQ